MNESELAVAEPAMVDLEVVQQIRGLHAQGWGAKRIARELEIARNTVRPSGAKTRSGSFPTRMRR